MKRFIALTISVLALFLLCGTVRAEDDVGLIIDQLLGLYDFSGWNYDDGDVHVNARDMIESYLNASETTTFTLFDYVLQKIKDVFLSKLPLVLFLLAVSIISGMASSLIPDEKSALQKTVSFIACALGAISVSAVFLSLTRSALTALNRTVNFAECAAPLASILLIASGRTAAEAVFSPAMAFLTGTAAGVIRTVLIPVILGGFVFAVASAVGSKERAGKLLSLAKTVCKWVCGITTAVFTGALTIYGLGAKAHDSLTLKTAKYVADKAIPGLGGLISGTADTILECTTAVKTAAGTVIIVIAVVIVSRVLFDILATTLALRLSSALSGALCDSRLSGLFSDTADVMGFLFAAVCAVNVLLIITVGMLMCVLS